MADTEIIPGGPLAHVARALRERLEIGFPAKQFIPQWMPARVDAKVWDRLTARLPMIAIGFNGFSRPQTTRDLIVKSTWSVYAVTVNQAGQEQVLFGDTLAPGQFALAQVAAALLHGFTIPDVGTVEMTEAANSMVEDFNLPGLSITAIEFVVTVDLSLRFSLSGAIMKPADLTGETIRWDFDGFAQTDTITIPRGKT